MQQHTQPSSSREPTYRAVLPQSPNPASDTGSGCSPLGTLPIYPSGSPGSLSHFTLCPKHSPASNTCSLDSRPQGSRPGPRLPWGRELGAESVADTCLRPSPPVQSPNHHPLLPAVPHPAATASRRPFLCAQLPRAAESPCQLTWPWPSLPLAAPLSPSDCAGLPRKARGVPRSPKQAERELSEMRHADARQSHASSDAGLQTGQGPSPGRRHVTWGARDNVPGYCIPV